MAWIKKNWMTVLLVLMGVVGVGLMAYPTIADRWNAVHQTQIIGSYIETVADLDDSERETILQDAETYNAALAASGMNWHMTESERARYAKTLTAEGSDVIGVIEIPKIKVYLPIYHGTDPDVLQSGIGHLEASSLPVGGADTHTILSGHRGLPSARLFTDLTQLDVGDTWTITVLGRTLTYEADAIHIVEPEDLSMLRIEPGADLCTLITCTPYGVNTHRLLVQGHRVANASGDAEAIPDAVQVDPFYIAAIIGAVIMTIVFVALFTIPRRSTKAFDSIVRSVSEKGKEDAT